MNSFNSSKISGFKFVKMCGAGNDFVVFDGQEAYHPFTEDEIQLICNRNFGIGSDGVLTIKPGHCSPLEKGLKPSFFAEFFNPDGSSGMLCGNGARCILKRAFELSYIPCNEKIKFLFAGSPYFGKVNENGLVTFYLDNNFSVQKHISLSTEKLSMSGTFININCEHFVVFISDIKDESGKIAYKKIDDVPVYELGKAIRSNKNIPSSNINFVDVQDGKVFVRTFERGVENETLACGTGSVSSALAVAMNNLLQSPIVVETRSRIELIISFDEKICEAPSDREMVMSTKYERLFAKSLSLTGQAINTFSGIIS